MSTQEVVPYAFSDNDSPFSGPHIHRVEGLNYPEDQTHPEDETINYDPIQDNESDLLDWVEDYTSKMYGGMHIGDDVKAKLFRVIYTQPMDNNGKGYSQLMGRLEAHRLEKRKLSLKDYNRTIHRTKEQIDEIKRILDPLFDLQELEQAERAGKVDKIVGDIRKKYSGEHNNTARRNEIKRLRALEIGEFTLKHAA